MTILSCADFDGGCCTSCHEDEAEGYDALPEVERGTELFARVCCAKLEQAQLRAKDITQPLTEHEA